MTTHDTTQNNKKLIHMIRKFLPFAAVAIMTVSCSDNDAPDTPAANGKDATFEAIARQYLANTVNVTYSNLADNAEQLVEDLKHVQADKSDANIRKACESFLEARKWWERSEAFLYGAAADFGIDPHIDSWPLDRAGLVAEMSNAGHIASLAADDGDAWAGAHLGPELLGFHGIEYIIFAAGAPKAASSIPDNELTYAIAVAGDLRNKTYQLELSWGGEDAVSSDRLAKVDEELEWPYTVANSGVSYTDNMLNAGKAGSTYRTWTHAMEAIIDGCMDIADEVGTQKIGKPHTGEDVNYIESPYSYKSITDFHDNMISIENAYMGGIPERRDEAKSLHAYIMSVNPALDTRLTAAIRNAQDKIAAIQAPFVLYYTHSSAREAMDACRDLSDALTEVKLQLSK